MATLTELQQRARELDISGRSSMSKTELEDAIAAAERTDVIPATRKSADAKKAKKAPARPLAWLGAVRPGHTGLPVLAAQVLLREHGYQLGAVDGTAGRETVRAVARFRADRGLPDGDTVDDDVWAALARAPR